MPLPARIVTPAFAGPITDAVLEQASRVARAATDGAALTEDGASLILWIAGPAFDELLQWRRRMALIRDVACPDNVLMFPGTGE